MAKLNISGEPVVEIRYDDVDVQIKVTIDHQRKEVVRTETRHFGDRDDEGAGDSLTLFVEDTVRDLEDLAQFRQRCAFCEKLSSEVERLINGPKHAICNECVDFCAGILSGKA